MEFRREAIGKNEGKSLGRGPDAEVGRTMAEDRMVRMKARVRGRGKSTEREQG